MFRGRLIAEGIPLRVGKKTPPAATTATGGDFADCGSGFRCRVSGAENSQHLIPDT